MKRPTRLSELGRRKLGDPIKPGRMVVGDVNAQMPREYMTNADIGSDIVRVRDELANRIEEAGLTEHWAMLYRQIKAAQAGRSEVARQRDVRDRLISILHAKVRRLEAVLESSPDWQCRKCGGSKGHGNAALRAIECLSCGCLETYREAQERLGW